MSVNNNYLPKGYKLESYRIEQVLGAGGFGVTYLAQDIHLNTQVVIKEFLPQEFSTREQGHQTIIPYTDTKEHSTYEYLLKKFLKEAQILASIKHPNVVRIFSFFEANNTAYFVMDYIAGESLKSYLERKGKLDEENIFSIVIPILEGLKEVHLANYLHRDIAPDNIYLCQNEMPMLIDFGAAKNATRAESTSLAAIVKSGYSAPEQYTSNAEQTNATDIYAMGSVLYNMISKKVAPESTIRQMALLNDEADPLEDVRKNPDYQKKYSKALLNTIHKALNIRPKNRFQSVQEMQKSLFEEADNKQNIQTQIQSKSNKNLQKPQKALKKIFYVSITIILLIVFFTLFSKKEVEKVIENTPLALIDQPHKHSSNTQERKNIKALKKECNSGNTNSCTELANNFRLKNNYMEVYHYAYSACSLGNAKGCGILSILYFQGLGTKRNFKESLFFAEKACDDNDAIGCMVHGLMHKDGLGGAKKDEKDANYFFTKAETRLEQECDKNSASDCGDLAFMYMQGWGSPINTVKAFPIFQKACSLNDREACSWVGDFYYMGDSVKKDGKKAMEFYKKACDLKGSKGCMNLGALYIEGLSIAKNQLKGKNLLKKSCNMSNAQGCYYTGLFYESIEKNQQRAREYYKIACDLYQETACSKIGISLKE